MTTTDIVLTATFSILLMVNLTGNTIVCIIVLKNQAMRTTMNFLLVNLAIADIIVALSLVPQYVLDQAFVHPSGTAGDYLCRFVTGGGWLWFGDKASLCVLVVIAVERYLVVLHPLTGRDRLSGKTLFRVIFLCWLFAFVLNVPNFVTPSYDEDPEFHCPQKWSSPAFGKAYTMLCYSVFGAIPLGIIVYLYTRVVYCLWDRNLTSVSSNQATTQKRKKITKMVIIVTLLFGILRAPNLVVYILSEFDPSAYKFGSTSYIVSVVLVTLNSTLNPFVYSLHSAKLREHLVGLFHTAKIHREINNEETPLIKYT